MDIMPKPEQFFLNIPLYKHFEIDEENYKDVLRVEFFKGTIDSFCVECKREGIFQRNIELPGVTQFLIILDLMMLRGGYNKLPLGFHPRSLIPDIQMLWLLKVFKIMHSAIELLL